MKALLKGTLLVGLTTVGLATAAYALQAHHGFDPASLDADRDGVISPTELDAHADALFTRTDQDHDDRLSADELRALHAMMPAGATMEHGGDPASLPLTRQAFLAALRGHASRMDADGDGRLTVAELGAAMHGDRGH